MKNSEILKLLRQHALILFKLRKGGVLRSGNNPTGDYAEYLVAQKLKLELTKNSNKSFDAKDKKTGITYQIKGRRITKSANSRQLGVLRSLAFDFLVAVIFREDFSVLEAYKIPKGILKPPYIKWSKHQHGNILMLKGAILEDKGVKKIKI